MFECTTILLVYKYPVNKESLKFKNKNTLSNTCERFLTSVGTLASDVITD